MFLLFESSPLKAVSIGVGRSRTQEERNSVLIIHSQPQTTRLPGEGLISDASVSTQGSRAYAPAGASIRRVAVGSRNRADWTSEPLFIHFAKDGATSCCARRRGAKFPRAHAALSTRHGQVSNPVTPWRLNMMLMHVVLCAKPHVSPSLRIFRRRQNSWSPVRRRRHE